MTKIGGVKTYAKKSWTNGNKTEERAKTLFGIINFQRAKTFHRASIVYSF